jgi:putative tryptophan/tyrosine transport system substrate-binding protein
MRRRDFLAAVAGSAAARPLAARAQQSGGLRTIGFLGPNTHSAASEWLAAFVQRLRELGWIEGRTVAIEYRWAEGRKERCVRRRSDRRRSLALLRGLPEFLIYQRPRPGWSPV